MVAYRGPLSTRRTREPTHIFPREILGSSDYLSVVESGLEQLSHLPVLLVWGDKDTAFRESDRARFERIFPHHRTVVLRGAGHYIQEDASQEIVELIAEWPG